MRTLVYRFGLRPPTENGDLVRRQMRLAHDMRNDLIQIERARRAVVRTIDATPEVEAAIGRVKAATRSTRKEALFDLSKARRAARESEYGRAEYARIEALAHEIRKSAYNYYDDLAWGTRLKILQSDTQSRNPVPKPLRLGYHVYDPIPLYDEDGVTPRDPRFLRWRGGMLRLGGGEGQAAVQLQNGLPTHDALSGQDRRARLSVSYAPERRGRSAHGYRKLGLPEPVGEVLSIRIASEGKDPIWARFPLALHRQIPDAARWQWVSVSLRQDRGTDREDWSCEITVDDDTARPRDRDDSLTGAIAVEVCADQPGDRIVVARWRDTQGRHGTIDVPEHIENGIRKPNGIRSVRDMTLKGDKENRVLGFRERLARALREDKDPKPDWLANAAATMHLWESQARFRDLMRQWQIAKCDAARSAYEMLDAWALRDDHLRAYETGARSTSVRYRNDWYRCLAAKWSRSYRHVIVDDRSLTRVARWGDDSDLRFIAGPSELRHYLLQAFGAIVERGQIVGGDATAHPTREEVSEDDDRDWCERAIDAWIAGGAREWAIVRKTERKKTNAWANRKKRKADREAQIEGAREPVAKVAE